MLDLEELFQLFDELHGRDKEILIFFVDGLVFELDLLLVGAVLTLGLEDTGLGAITRWLLGWFSGLLFEVAHVLVEFLDAGGVVLETCVLCLDLGACTEHYCFDGHRDEKPDLFGPRDRQLLLTLVVLQMLVGDAPDLLIVLVEFLRDHCICQECFCEQDVAINCLRDAFLLCAMALIVGVLDVLEQSQAELLYGDFGHCLFYWWTDG